MTVTSAQFLEALSELLNVETPADAQPQCVITIAEFLLAAANGYSCTDPQNKTIRVPLGGVEVPTISQAAHKEVSYTINRCINSLQSSTVGVRERAVFAIGCILACLNTHKIIDLHQALPAMYKGLLGLLNTKSFLYDVYRGQRLGYLYGVRIILEMGGFPPKSPATTVLVKDLIRLGSEAGFAKFGGELTADLVARLLNSEWSRQAVLDELSSTLPNNFKALMCLEFKDGLKEDQHHLLITVDLLLKVYQLHTENVPLGPLSTLMKQIKSQHEKFISKCVILGLLMGSSGRIQPAALWPLLFYFTMIIDPANPAALHTFVDTLTTYAIPEGRKNMNTLGQAIKLSALFFLWGRVLIESGDDKVLDLGTIFETVLSNPKLRAGWFASLRNANGPNYSLAQILFSGVLDMIAGESPAASEMWRQKMEAAMPPALRQGKKRKIPSHAVPEMPVDALDLTPIGAMAVLEHVSNPKTYQNRHIIFNRAFQTPWKTDASTKRRILLLFQESIEDYSLLDRLAKVLGPSEVSEDLVKQCFTSSTEADFFNSFKLLCNIADRNKDTRIEYILACLIGLSQCLAKTQKFELPKSLKKYLPKTDKMISLDILEIETFTKTQALFSDFVGRLRGSILAQSNSVDAIKYVYPIIHSLAEALSNSSIESKCADELQILALPKDIMVIGRKLFAPIELQEDADCAKAFIEFEKQLDNLKDIAVTFSSRDLSLPNVATELTTLLSSLNIEVASNIEITQAPEDQLKAYDAWAFLRRFKTPIFLAHSAIDIVLGRVIVSAGEAAFDKAWALILDEEESDSEPTTAGATPADESSSSETDSEEQDDSSHGEEEDESDIDKDALNEALKQLCAEGKVPENSDDIIIDSGADFMQMLMTSENAPASAQTLVIRRDKKISDARNAQRSRALRLVERRVLAMLDRVASESSRIETVQATLMRLCDIWHEYGVACPLESQKSKKQQSRQLPPGWLTKLQDFCQVVLDKLKGVMEKELGSTEIPAHEINDHFSNTMNLYASTVDMIGDSLDAARLVPAVKMRKVFKQIGHFLSVFEKVAEPVLKSHQVINLAQVKTLMGEELRSDLWSVPVHPALVVHPSMVRCTKCSKRHKDKVNSCQKLPIGQAVVLAAVVRELQIVPLSKSQINEFVRGLFSTAPKMVSQHTNVVMFAHLQPEVGLFREALGIFEN